MNEFQRYNKTSGVHWIKQPIVDLIIKISIKHENEFDLPTSQDLDSSTPSLTFTHNTNSKICEYTFKWQEKVFSLWEVARYTDSHLCITDTELKYHGILNGSNIEPGKVFTYVHEDNFNVNLEVPKTTAPGWLDNITSCFDGLSINTNVRESSSMGHLFMSEENIVNDTRWVSMHVVLDDSKYNEESQLILKRDTILLSLHYDTCTGSLLVSPEVNNLEWNPYSIEGAGRRAYSVELVYEDTGGAGDDLAILLSQLKRRWRKENRQLLTFAAPPVGKREHLVTVEILSAKEFEMDNLYVEYNIRLPHNCECSADLHGKTHVTKGIVVENHLESHLEWGFGHVIELSLITNSEAEIPPVLMFLEVISTDWWGRSRTEGYTYLNVPLQPGSYHKELRCIRPEELDKVEADSRRFFVGGCNIIKDLDFLLTPSSMPTYRCVSAGQLFLRYSVISQRHVTGGTLPRRQEHPQLLMGAEEVLRQYRKARARLVAAKKDIDQQQLDVIVPDYDSDDDS